MNASLEMARPDAKGRHDAARQNQSPGDIEQLFERIESMIDSFAGRSQHLALQGDTALSGAPTPGLGNLGDLLEEVVRLAADNHLAALEAALEEAQAGPTAPGADLLTVMRESSDLLNSRLAALHERLEHVTARLRQVDVASADALQPSP